MYCTVSEVCPELLKHTVHMSQTWMLRSRSGRSLRPFAVNYLSVEVDDGERLLHGPKVPREQEVGVHRGKNIRERGGDSPSRLSRLAWR